MTMLILMVAISVSAQTYMYKAERGKATVTSNWDDAETVEVTKSIIFTYNPDDEQIKFVTESEVTTFYIRSYTPETSGEGDNKQNYYLFKCVNSDGILCDIIASWFDDETLAYDGEQTYRWSIHYGNIWIAYYCNEL